MGLRRIILLFSSEARLLRVCIRRLPRILHFPRAAKTHPVHFGVGVSPVALHGPHARRAVDPAASTEAPLRSLLRPFRVPLRPCGPIPPPRTILQ